jgi:hypothetical protein
VEEELEYVAQNRVKCIFWNDGLMWKKKGIVPLPYKVLINLKKSLISM